MAGNEAWAILCEEMRRLALILRWLAALAVPAAALAGIGAPRRRLARRHRTGRRPITPAHAERPRRAAHDHRLGDRPGQRRRQARHRRRRERRRDRRAAGDRRRAGPSDSPTERHRPGLDGQPTSSSAPSAGRTRFSIYGSDVNLVAVGNGNGCGSPACRNAEGRRSVLAERRRLHVAAGRRRPTSAPIGAPARRRHGGKPQTVLVVEDEASIASFVSAYLKNAGLQRAHDCERRGGVEARRVGEARARRPRPDAARHRRRRGVQADPRRRAICRC